MAEYSIEIKNQKTLVEIRERLNTLISTGATAGLASEATLISLLNATIASDQDIEILLVRDTVTGTVYQQITDYQTGTPVVSYKDVNGAIVVPANPLEYLDPSTVLNLILTELEGINTKTTAKTNLELLKASNDLVKTFVYYTLGATPAENPSGNKNILSITYSATGLTTATETFTWDIDDDVLTITLS